MYDEQKGQMNTKLDGKIRSIVEFWNSRSQGKGYEEFKAYEESSINELYELFLEEYQKGCLDVIGEDEKESEHEECDVELEHAGWYCNDHEVLMYPNEAPNGARDRNRSRQDMRQRLQSQIKSMKDQL